MLKQNRNALTNLTNRYRAVLRRCRLRPDRPAAPARRGRKQRRHMGRQLLYRLDDRLRR